MVVARVGHRRIGLGWVLGLAAACTRPVGDAEHYTVALSEASSYAESAAACAAVDRESTRFDCTLAILERWNRLEDADCEVLAAGVLQDECRFQLAERRFRAGDLPAAIATCEASRFRRPCSWHLVRDVAEASVGRPMVDAETDVRHFANASAIPDAAKQYWTVFTRKRIGQREVVDEAECEALKSPDPCRDAFFNLVLDLLRETAGDRVEAMCNRAFGERITLRGHPVWVAGPITRRAEALWEERHCVPHQPPKPSAPSADP